jgi:hypothetical protein
MRSKTISTSPTSTCLAYKNWHCDARLNVRNFSYIDGMVICSYAILCRGISPRIGDSPPRHWDLPDSSLFQVLPGTSWLPHFCGLSPASPGPCFCRGMVAFLKAFAITMSTHLSYLAPRLRIVSSYKRAPQLHGPSGSILSLHLNAHLSYVAAPSHQWPSVDLLLTFSWPPVDLLFTFCWPSVYLL